MDTDLGYDVDDAGALAVLHALADRGEADILATVTVVGDPLSAGALGVINTYYGRPDAPVGAMKGAAEFRPPLLVRRQPRFPGPPGTQLSE